MARRPFEPDPDHAGVGNGICSDQQSHIPRGEIRALEG